MRKRVNGITKNKGAVYKGAVVLSTIFIFGVSMKVVYSNSKFDIKFKYLGEEFDPQTNIFNQENNPKWFFNNAARSEVKLEVDFSEYYRIAKGNFSVTNKETEIPFAVVAKIVTENDTEGSFIEAKYINIKKIIPQNGEFEGKYNVIITVPEGNNDDKVDIKISSRDDNNWGIPNGLSEDVYVIRDTQNPEVLLTGISEDLMVQNEVFVELNDNYKDTANIAYESTDSRLNIEEITREDGTKILKITPAEDGKYQVKVIARDKAGNESEENINFNVNNVAPIVKFNGEALKSTYNTRNIEITIQNDSDIDFSKDKAKYRLYDNKDSENPVEIDSKQLTRVDKKNAKAIPNIISDGKYKLMLDIYNIDGIKNTENIEHSFIVDTVKPEVNILDVIEGKTYNTKQKVKFEIKENNLKATKLKVNGVVVNPSELKLVSSREGISTYEYETKIKENEINNFNLEIIAEDEVGLKSDPKTINFVIDRTNPTVEFTGVDNNGYYNTDKIVKVKVEDEALDYDSLSFKVKKYLNENATVDVDYKNEAGENLVFNNGKVEIPFNEEGVYEIQVSGNDQSGNAIAENDSKIKFTIDKEAPTVEFFDEEDSGTKLISENVYNMDKVKVKVEDKALDYGSLSFKVKKYLNDNDTEYIKYEDLEFENGEVIIPFNEDGIYEIQVSGTDRSGNRIAEQDGKIKLIIDKTKPVVSIEDQNEYKNTVEPVIFSVNEVNFEQSNLDFTVKKTKANSELEPIEVKEENIKKISEENGVYKFELVGLFKEDAKYDVTINFNDKAGNSIDTEKSKNQVSFTVDKTQPTINIQQIKNKDYYKDNRDVTITTFDVNNEINNIIITKDGKDYIKEKLEKEGKKIGFLKQGKTATLKHLFTEEGNYEVKVESIDSAGNKAESENIRFVIDKEAPTVEFFNEVDSETKLINENVYNIDKVKVKVSDKNLDDNNIRFDVKKYLNDSDTVEVDYKNEAGEKLGFKDGEVIIPFNEDGIYEIQVSGTDKSGNPINEEVGKIKFIIDKTKPVVNIKNYDTLNGSFNKKVDSVKFSVNEANFEQSNLKFTVKKTKPNSEPVDIEVKEESIKKLSDENGNYEFELAGLFKDDSKYDISINITDKAGNPIDTKSKNSVAFTVDNTNPEVEIKTVADGNYYNLETVPLEVRVKDNNHNTNKVIIEKISKKIGENQLVEKNEYTESSTSEGNIKVFKLVLTEEATYNVTVESTDMAGNSNEEKEPYSFVIDRKEPLIETNFEGLNETYNNSTKTATIKISELNWENKYTGKPLIAIVKGKKLTPNKKEVDIDLSFPLTGEVTEKSFTDEFNDDAIYNLNVSISDSAGINGKSQSVKFITDKTEPTINIEGIKNEKYYDGNRDVIITTTDVNNDINNVTVKKDGKDYSIGEFSKEGIERTLKYSFTEEGNYEVEVESIDKAKNRKTSDNIFFTIDKQAPQLKIIDSNDGEDIVSGKHYNKFKNIEVILTDNNLKSYTLKVNGKEEKFKDEENSKVLKYTLEANKDGVYEVSVGAIDKSGNNLTEDKKEKVTSFVIDTTKPIVNIEGFDSLNNSFNKKVDSVKVNINEINFDKNNLKVNLKATEPNKETKATVIEGKNIEVVQIKDEKGNYIDGKYEFVLNKLFTMDGKYDISVEMTDIVGNPIDESSKNSVSFTVDNTIPDIRVVTPEDKKYYKDNEVPLEIRIKDNNHEVNRVTVEKISKKLGEEAKVEKNDYTDFVAEGSDQAFKRIFKDEGTYNISVYSKDKAGNENKLPEIYSFVIDRTQPIIETNFFSINETYSNPQKNAYIKVSEVNWKNEYTGKALIANVKGEKITPDNKTTSIDLSFPLTGEVTEVNYGNEFADDAIYNLNVSISDYAGIAGNSQSVKFVTDKTSPSISVEGIENDQYYNMDRYLVIKNNDVNHNINKITIKRNGNEYLIGDFATEGRDKIAKHTFSQEGEYEVSVTSTDKAGNSVVHPTIKFTIDKTAPVITPLNRNENKVLQNGQYINKLFIPEFKLDKPEDDKIDFISINGEGNFANSTLMADKEIEYKYKVVASDKAKNSTNLDIGFTVDVTLPEVKISGILSGFFNKDMRPVYDITDKNLDKEKTSVTLNGTPFESGTVIKEQDNYNLKLVGTDLANNIVTKTIGFTIDKDKPVIRFEEEISGKYFTEDFIPNFVIDDLTDYTIISMTLDGEDFEVGQEIKEEGKHVLYIEVKDKAENIESVSIEFILDKTPPKFIVDGIEDGGKYFESVSAKIKLDNPMDKIQGVEVNGELAKGNIKDENGQEVIEVDFNELNSYELKLTAIDKAGNLTEDILNFEVVQKNIFVKLYQNKSIFYPFSVIVVAGIFSTVFIIFRKSKKQSEIKE